MKKFILFFSLVSSLATNYVFALEPSSVTDTMAQTKIEATQPKTYQSMDQTRVQAAAGAQSLSNVTGVIKSEPNADNRPLSDVINQQRQINPGFPTSK